MFDEEFEDLVARRRERRKRFIGWHEEESKLDDPTIEALVESGDTDEVVAPTEKGRVVILTSGTTGTPKGASRSQPETLDPAAALLSKIPLRTRERTMIAAPMFHSWGFAHFTLGMALSSTLVLRRKFDPEGTLSAVAQHRCSTLVVVPVMLQRMLDLGEEVISQVRHLEPAGDRRQRLRAARGAGHRVMDVFGDVSTTSMARPRWRGRRSPRPRTCRPPRARRAGRPAARS